MSEVKWIRKEECRPDRGKRVLVFSPGYEKGDPMRMRMCDGTILRHSGDFTHWAELEGMEPEDTSESTVCFQPLFDVYLKGGEENAKEEHAGPGDLL